MTRFLLLLIIICLTVYQISPDQILKIEIVIPGELIPYFEWLISFPGIAPQQEENPIPVEVFLHREDGVEGGSQRLISPPAPIQDQRKDEL